MDERANEVVGSGRAWHWFLYTALAALFPFVIVVGIDWLGGETISAIADLFGKGELLVATVVMAFTAAGDAVIHRNLTGWSRTATFCQGGVSVMAAAWYGAVVTQNVRFSPERVAHLSLVLFVVVTALSVSTLRLQDPS